MAAFVFILYLVARYFITGVGVPGWTSVMAAVMLFSGILTLFNGLIAIYIGSIFLEVKRRPRVIVTAVYKKHADETQ
ncbi:putative glycosyltransferase CsbB [compost metagenome]